MKRWAIVTIALYGLLLVLLTVPLVLLAAFGKPDSLGQWNLTPGEAIRIFKEWWYWIILGVFVIAQGAMLVVPVATSERRPKARRRLLVPIVTATFLLANLFFAGLFAILAATMGDNASKVVEWPAELIARTAGQLPAVNNAITTVGFTPNAEFFSIINLIGLLLLFWMLWGLIFYHFARTDEPETLTQRATRWLLRGSILELLIAVPSHIIVRNRNDCCAPFATFWGIVTGVAVTLVAFGPGVFFLLAARMRKLRPRETGVPPVDGIPPVIGPR